MLDYQVAYDLASQRYTTWHLALFPLGFAILFLVLRPHYERKDQWVIKLVIGVTLFMTIAVLVITWDEDRWYRQQVAKGRFRSVEGTVTDFIPEGAGGHPPESFRVDTVTFHYSTADAMPGFHQTMRAAGPLRAGLHVRIRDVNGTIVRLEIAR